MGLFPSKDEMAKRAAVFAIDTLNDAIDTPEKRAKVASIINPHLDAPLLDEHEEQIGLELALDKMNTWLQKIERALRDNM